MLPNDKRYFVFAILKNSLIHISTSLADFFSLFLPVVKACAAAAESASNETQKQQLQKEIASIWGVFASCCVGAKDVAAVLPSYRKALLRVLNDEKNLEAGYQVACGLAMLALRNRPKNEKEERSGAMEQEMELQQQPDQEEEQEELEKLEKLEEAKEETKNESKSELDSMLEEQSIPYLQLFAASRAPESSPDQVQQAFSALQAASESFLKALIALYRRSHGATDQEINPSSGVAKSADRTIAFSLRSVLQTMFSVAPSSVVSQFFASSLASLQQSIDTNSPLSLDLLAEAGVFSSLIPSISNEEVPAALTFLTEMAPKLRVVTFQRRLSRAFVLLCEYHAELLFERNLFGSLSTALLDQLFSVDINVRYDYLQALFYLWNALSPQDKEHIQLVVQVLPRLILCIKDSNQAIRAVSFKLLILLSDKMAAATVNLVQPTGEEVPASLAEYFRILMGGLSATSARMQSASLMCISCVLFHHRSNETIIPLMREALHITYGLLESKSREVAKACLGFVRTCFKVFPEEVVREEMHEVIRALQPWSNDHYGNFKLRVKAIFELSLRRIGKQTMDSLLSEEEKAIVESILGGKKADKEKTDEEFVEEMEREGEQMELSSEDELEVMEMDENGNVVGEQTGETSKLEMETLMKEIEENEGWKRIMKRSMEEDGKEEFEEEEEEEVIDNEEIDEMDEEKEKGKSVKNIKKNEKKGKKEKKEKKGKKEQ